MNEKIKGYLGKAKEILKKVSKKVWILIAAALVLIIAVIAVYMNSRPYTVLVTGASNSETTTILNWLDEQGVTDYRMESDNTVLVPAGQAVNLKARLMMAGYPKSGYSFDSSTYTENVSMLSTESEREKAWLLFLQEEMAAIISCLDGIEEAAVVITPGEDRGYVLDSGNVVEASASVSVTMRDGSSLTDEQAMAIRNFVANGVQGLEVDAVTIIDNWGNTYMPGEDGGISSDASDLKLRLETAYNNKIRTQVMTVLTPLFGEENVRVGVNCVVEVGTTTTNSTTYELPEYAQDGSTGGRGIIGSRVWEDGIIDTDDETVGGVPGTESNADLSTYVENELEADGNEEEIYTSGQEDFLVDQHNTQESRPAGYLTDCSIAVSVNSAAVGTVDVEAVRDHVARAAGISAVVTETMTAAEYLASKISVLPWAFYVPPVVDFIAPEFPVPMWAMAAAAGGFLLFLILLIIILSIRRKRKRRLDEERQRREVEELLAAAGMFTAEEPRGADVMDMQSERSMELRKDIRQFAEENPEIAAHMIRMWLRGGDEDG